MNDVFEKIKEKLEELKHFDVNCRDKCKKYDWSVGACEGNCNEYLVSRAIEIIDQVTEEYSVWDIIYNKVLQLEKEYADAAEEDCVNDCIRLENLLQYFKEELRDCTDINVGNKDGWIPVRERLPDVPEGTEDAYCPEFNVTIEGAIKATTLKCDPEGTWFDDLGYVYKVLAWQPLPEPYQPKGE